MILKDTNISSRHSLNLGTIPFTQVWGGLEIITALNDTFNKYGPQFTRHDAADLPELIFHLGHGSLNAFLKTRTSPMVVHVGECGGLYVTHCTNISWQSAQSFKLDLALTVAIVFIVHYCSLQSRPTRIQGKFYRQKM